MGKDCKKDSPLGCMPMLGGECLRLSLVYVYHNFWLRVTRLLACVAGALRHRGGLGALYRQLLVVRTMGVIGCPNGVVIRPI
jgi:hypothetical protein